MKSLVTGIVSGAVAGGLAAAVTVVLLASDEAPPPTARAATPAGDAQLAARVAALEKERDDLRMRLGALEQRPAVAAAPRETVAPIEGDELAALQDELHALAGALRDPGSGDLPPGFVEGVGQALDAIRAQEDREREERRQEVLEERIDERLAELAQELGLTRVQTGELRTAYLDLDAKRTELFRNARDTGDFGSVRDGFRDLRRDTDAALERILTPLQLEQYRELEDDRRGFGGGPGFGDGPPGGFGGDDGRGRRGGR